MSSTFDTMMEKLKDVASAATKKTNDFVEISRCKLQMSSINAEMEKIYKRIGVVVYESRRNGADSTALIDSCIGEIDALVGQLQELSRRIDEIRAANRCAACGFENVPEAQFCAGCGAPLAAGQTEPDPEQPEEPQPGQPVYEPQQDDGLQEQDAQEPQPEPEDGEAGR